MKTKTQNTFLTYEGAWAILASNIIDNQQDEHVRAWRRHRLSQELFLLPGDAVRKH